MQIHSLSLTNFRALKRMELELPNQLTLFHGGNAQGKTSILEAIHLASLMSSPIASHDREILNFSSLEEHLPVCRIVVGIEKKGVAHKLEVRLIINQSANSSRRLVKEVLLDGVKRRLFDAVGFFNSVLFLPQMTRVIEDGPEERRKYLDQTLSQVLPGYIRTLNLYQQGLVRRNALLKQLQEKGGDENQLDYWDRSVAENGAAIIQARQVALAELGRLFAHQHLAVTTSKEIAKLAYLPSFFPGSQAGGSMNILASAPELHAIAQDEISQKYCRALQQRRKEEIRRGVTTIGPHRDDLAFFANDVDLRVYGSRGQIRSAVMSLKLAETLWYQEKSGELPVLLLDETLAELDHQRRGKLLASLSNGWQAIFTTADLRLFSEEFIKRCVVWEVQAGSLTQPADQT